MFRKYQTIFVLVMIASLVLSACASTATTQPAAPTAEPTKATVAQPTEAPTAAPTNAPVVEPTSAPKATLPEVDPASVSGDIIAAGSSTVYPLAEVMAERFKDEGFAGNITIDSIGSGAGFERFCVNGETDIANASRGIKSSEVESCAAIQRTPIEFRVGTDALAVVVSAENDFLTDITLEELAKIYSSEATQWSDIRADWPAEDILRFSPGTDSGTFDFFVEFVMGVMYKNAEGKADLEAGENSLLNASNLQLSEDDNVLVQGVEGSKYAIGYFGYAYFAENQGALKALSLNGVAPDFSSAEDGSYPLARPLYIYSDASILQAKPQVAAFINFFLTYVNEEITSVGYFPASTDALDVSRQSLLDAMSATIATVGVMLPEVDPASVSGEIIAAGSSTVYPLAEVMAERFKDEGFAGNITIDSIGSGAGFERFCVNGETDIANASRGIKSSEVESCGAIQRTPIEFRVGTDALAVVVSAENDFLTDITLEELAKIYSDEATQWSDIRADWPAEDILRFSPGTDSGTFDFFVEFVMGVMYKNAEGKADLEAGENSLLNASNLQLSEDDNVLVQGVEGSKYAIGYFGYAYFAENQGALKALSLNGVVPDFASAEDGSYPLARPLYIYSDAGILQAKPQVAAFINFFLTYVDEEITSVGYFPASQESLDASKQALLDALK